MGGYLINSALCLGAVELLLLAILTGARSAMLDPLRLAARLLLALNLVAICSWPRTSALRSARPLVRAGRHPRRARDRRRRAAAALAGRVAHSGRGGPGAGVDAGGSRCGASRDRAAAASAGARGARRTELARVAGAPRLSVRRRRSRSSGAAGTS